MTRVYLPHAPHARDGSQPPNAPEISLALPVVLCAMGVGERRGSAAGGMLGAKGGGGGGKGGKEGLEGFSNPR